MEDDDHDAWWAKLPVERKAQIRRWLAKGTPESHPIPGQFSLLELEGSDDGNLQDPR